jgi:hypothetical protein
MPRSPHLATWTGPEIFQECRAAYRAYASAKTESYRAYFVAHPELKDEHHPYKARDLVAALPEEWAGLEQHLLLAERHRHHLSGNSSQVLALGLLGVGARLNPQLSWLWEGLGSAGSVPASSGMSVPTVAFEHKLDAAVLNEHPRQTAVDFFVNDPQVLFCVECKWVEAGLGECSCPAPGPLTGGCSERVLQGEAYWKTAYEVFHLPEREAGKACPLSFTYQAVRNVAAATALASPHQTPVFGLIYDADNPYFGGCGEWPGWPAALAATLDPDESRVRFASDSWQELAPMLPLDPAAAAWAMEKHGLMG